MSEQRNTTISDLIQLLSSYIPPRIGEEIVNVGVGWSQYNQRNGEPYWLISEENRDNLRLVSMGKISRLTDPPPAVTYTTLRQVKRADYRGRQYFLYLP